MRLIKICEYDELSNPAKLVAISNLRNEYINHIKVCDWKDVRRTKKKYEKLFGVNVDIREIECSQGYYWFDYKDKTNSDGDHDLELWEENGELVKQTETDLWSDDIFVDTFLGFVFDNNKSYGYNVANLFVRFVEKAYRETEEGISEITDNEIEGYIENNDFRFFENGKKFIG